MKRPVLAAIRLYQQFVSPVKGFSCAYRVHTGRASCSAYGYRVIERFGLWPGLKLIKRRFHKCGEQFDRHVAMQPLHKTAFRYRGQEAGHCDIGADVPDLSSCACDVMDTCAPSPCDLDFGIRERRKKKNQEKYVDVGPAPLEK